MAKTRTTQSYTTTPAPKRKPNTRGGKRKRSSSCPTLDASVPGGITISHSYRPTKADRAGGDT